MLGSRWDLGISFSVFVLAAGNAEASTEEAERDIRETIEFHLKGLRADGAAIPLPSSAIREIDITA